MFVVSMLAQLVSDEQVSAAYTRAILWTLFALVMLGICIWKIVSAVKRRKEEEGDKE